MQNERLAEGMAICRLLGSAVRGVPFDGVLPSESVVMTFAEGHHILSLVGGALTLNHCEESYAELIKKSKQAVLKQVKIDAFEQTLCYRLNEHNIPYCILKGTQMRAFYPAGLVRTSADVDIFIPSSHIEAANALLCDDGFASVYSTPTDLSYERPPRYRVELHTTMEGVTEQQRRRMMVLYHRARSDNGLRRKLDDNDHYLYTLMHLYKHFVETGVGVRMVLDIYVLEQTATLDRSYIDAMTQALGIHVFAQRIRQLGKILFEGAPSTTEFDCLTAYVFAGHAFGTQDIYMALAPLRTALGAESRLQRLQMKYGLSCYAMEQRYPVLKKVGILYPLCVAHRAVRGMMFKRVVWREACNREQIAKRQYRAVLEDVMRIAGIL